jgi:hypothetical protein
MHHQERSSETRASHGPVPGGGATALLYPLETRAGGGARVGRAAQLPAGGCRKFSNPLGAGAEVPSGFNPEPAGQLAQMDIGRLPYPFRATDCQFSITRGEDPGDSIPQAKQQQEWSAGNGDVSTVFCLLPQTREDGRNWG